MMPSSPVDPAGESVEESTSMRLLLVIGLLMQSIVPAGPIRAADAPAPGGSLTCAPAGCCCCPVAAVPAACSPAQADACMCGPTEPARGPEAPVPSGTRDLAPFVALWPAGVAAALPDTARHGLPPQAQPALAASGNRAQALLCIWRT